jgi:hypothetical protein
MQVIIPAMASIIATIFAASVIDQYRTRRRPYQLIWAIGLVTWAVGTGAEAIIGATGIHPLPYRVWYLCGAIFTAAWLGLGSLYLQLGKRAIAGHITALILFLTSAVAAVLALTADIDLANAYAGGHLVGGAFPLYVRLLTPFFNVFGTVLLVGVALWSVTRYWRSSESGSRVIANLLILVGALLPALGGSLSKFGTPEFLWLSELLGIVIIFLGFLRSQNAFGFPKIWAIHSQSQP